MRRGEMIKNILLAAVIVVWLFPLALHAHWYCSCGNSVSTKCCTFCGRKEPPPQTPTYTPPKPLPRTYDPPAQTPGHEPPAPICGDPAPRPAAQAWPKPKEWFFNECNVMERNVRYYASGGYRYDRSSANRVGALISALRTQLSLNDVNGSVRAYNELKQEYRSFVNGCQWQANMRHPRYNHVVSSQTPGRWDAENGWEFVNPGTSDLTVRRKPVQVRCTACRGSGYVMQKTRCYSCNGRGRVPNPAAQVGQVFNDVGRMLGRGRGGRSVPRIPQAPSEIRCSSCNGTGNLQQRIACDRCSGTGSVYR